jgi:hypothetical protein
VLAELVNGSNGLYSIAILLKPDISDIFLSILRVMAVGRNSVMIASIFT